MERRKRSPRKAHATFWTYRVGPLLTVAAEELNEEDQNLKNELEMLVARLHVCLPTRHLVLVQLAHHDVRLGIRQQSL